VSAPLPASLTNVSIASLCTIFFFVVAVSMVSAAIFLFSPLGVVGFIVASFCSAIVAVPATALIGAPLVLLAMRLLGRFSSVILHTLGAATAGALTGALTCLAISPLFRGTLDAWGVPQLIVGAVLTVITALSAAGGWLIAWIARARPVVAS